jgi:hypothetical protein
MVNINQIAVQVQMRIPPLLDSGIGGFARWRGGREIDLGEHAVRCDGDFGERLGGECCGVDDDFLDGAVGGLRPGGG